MLLDELLDGMGLLYHFLFSLAIGARVAVVILLGLLIGTEMCEFSFDVFEVRAFFYTLLFFVYFKVGSVDGKNQRFSQMFIVVFCKSERNVGTLCMYCSVLLCSSRRKRFRRCRRSLQCLLLGCPAPPAQSKTWSHLRFSA